MPQNLDLLGDPIPDGWGKRGRPQHIATTQNRMKVKLLLSFGWSNERIARALGITQPTLRRNYFQVLKARDEMRDRVDAQLAVMLFEQARKGNTAAAKEFRALQAGNDLMGAQDAFRHLGRGQAEDTDDPEKPIGKKEQAARDAIGAGAGTPWGDDLKIQ